MVWMDKDGKVTMNDNDGNAVYLQKGKGITLHSPNDDITLIGKKIVLAPETNVYVGDPAQAADIILGTSAFSKLYDVHTHKGPVGPPAVTIMGMESIVSAKGIVTT